MNSTIQFATIDSAAAVPLVSSNGLLDQAYDEFCLMEEAGIQVRSEEFLQRYPNIKSSLARLIELHRGVEDAALTETALVWPKVGDDFHGFRLLRHLGDGASSRVFLAKELALGDRFVAVKITRQGDAEAYTLGRVKHPNVIPIYSRTPVPGLDLSIICMEYLGSATLCSLLDRVLASDQPPANAGLILEAARDPLLSESSTPELTQNWSSRSFEAGVRQFFAQVCDALVYLHGRNILHRDLKPSNILMRPDGSPVLLDFNLARDLHGPAGRFGGTYPYMPPEQLKAMAGASDAPSSAVDERSDLFAVGVLLWETLTGRLPFGAMPTGVSSADGIRELLARQKLGFRAPMPEGWSVSPQLVALVRRCLSFDPTERPTTAAELRRLLVPEVVLRRRMPRILTAAAVVFATIGVAAVANIPSTQANVAGHYREGTKALSVGDHRRAYEEFTKVVNLRRDDPRGWRARALASVKEETYDKDRIQRALADSQEANSLDAADIDFAYTGYLKQLQGSIDVAESQYQEALKRKQSTTAVNNNLSAIYLSLGKLDEAFAAADRAHADAPDAQAPLVNRGLAQYKKAITAVAGVKLTDAMKRTLRANCVADLEKAAKIGPDCVELQLKIATALVCPTPIEGDALTHLERAVSLGHDPKKLATDISFKGLRLDPAFAELQNRQPGNVAQVKLPRLISPRTEPPVW